MAIDMIPSAPSITKEAGVVKTHPCVIILGVALGHLLFALAPLKAADNVIENLDDAAITDMVKRSLLFHLSHNFKVETKEAVVTLSGNADNIAELDLNTRLATGIVGVKRVVNHMVIPLIVAGTN